MFKMAGMVQKILNPVTIIKFVEVVSEDFEDFFLVHLHEDARVGWQICGHLRICGWSL